MPKRLVNEIRLSELGIYQLWEEDAEGLPLSRHDLEPDSEAYFVWLATLPSSAQIICGTNRRPFMSTH